MYISNWSLKPFREHQSTQSCLMGAKQLSPVIVLIQFFCRLPGKKSDIKFIWRYKKKIVLTPRPHTSMSEVIYL